MKQIFKFTGVVLLLFFVTIAFGQTIDTTGLSDQPFPGGGTLNELLGLYETLYMGLIIVWGYVAKLLKLSFKPGKFIFVILAGGIVLGGAFLWLGWAKVVPLLFGFLSSIGIYDLFLKPFGLTIKRELPQA